MNTLRQLLISPGGEVFLRWTVLLLLAWIANGMLARNHPRWRLILWRSVLVLVFLLPLGVFFPFAAFRIPIGAVSGRTPAGSNVVAPAAAREALSVVVGTAAAAARTSSGQAEPVSYRTDTAAAANSGMGLVALVWGLGFLAGAFRLVYLRVRLSRLRKNASGPNAELLALANEIRSRLGIRERVDIRISDEAMSPFVCGLWNPVIILPAELLLALTTAESSALLSHEMAHLRSHDLAWCVGWRWMKTVVWFHPLAWKIPAAHNLACEQEADRIASDKWTDNSLYSQLLARLTLRVLALPAVETTLALNGCSQIAKRLKLLRRDRFAEWKMRDSLTGLAMVAGLVLVTAGWGLSRANAADAADVANSKVSNPSSVAGGQIASNSPPGAVEMKRYEDAQWKFALDIPKSWHAFPPVSSNSPFEVIRFESRENGNHDLIVFRSPIDPTRSQTEWVAGTQKTLAKGGFGNFVVGTAIIGSKQVATLDFDKTGPTGTWSCRHYFIADGTLGYVLGFGTTNRAEMIELYDRMAKSFRNLE